MNKCNTNIGQCTNGKMTGGSAFVAYPEKYGDKGIATFMINQNGVVYEKNLGKDTVDLAKGIIEFNPDKTWASGAGLGIEYLHFS